MFVRLRFPNQPKYWFTSKKVSPAIVKMPALVGWKQQEQQDQRRSLATDLNKNLWARVYYWLQQYDNNESTTIW